MTWDDQLQLTGEWLRLAGNDVHVVEKAVIKATEEADGPPTFGQVRDILEKWNHARAA